MAQPTQNQNVDRDAVNAANQNDRTNRARNAAAEAASNFGRAFTETGRGIVQAGSDFISQIVPFGTREVQVSVAGRLDDSDKRWLFRIEFNPNTLSIREGYAANAKHLRAVRFSPEFTEIPASAFIGCEKLTDVDFATLVNLTSIGANAFNGTGIRNLPLDQLNNVTYIGAGAFQDCRNFKHLNFDENCELRVIGDYAFAGCKNLTDQRRAFFGGRGDFTIPPKVEELGTGCFASCRKIKSLEIGPNVKTIKGNPFVSPDMKKEDGSLSLRSRWHLWRTKINVPGVDKPLKAKEFVEMTTDLNGLRHIKTTKYHYIQLPDGTYRQEHVSDYEKYLEEQASIINNHQLSREEISAYFAQAYGWNIAPEQIPESIIVNLMNGLNQPVTNNGVSQTIDPKVIKEFGVKYQIEQEKAAANAAGQMGKQMAENLEKSGFVGAYQQGLDERTTTEQATAEQMAEAFYNAGQALSPSEQEEEKAPETRLVDKGDPVIRVDQEAEAVADAPAETQTLEEDKTRSFIETAHEGGQLTAEEKAYADWQNGDGSQVDYLDESTVEDFLEEDRIAEKLAKGAELTDDEKKFYNMMEDRRLRTNMLNQSKEKQGMFDQQTRDVYEELSPDAVKYVKNQYGISAAPNKIHEAAAVNDESTRGR